VAFSCHYLFVTFPYNLIKILKDPLQLFRNNKFKFPLVASALVVFKKTI